MTKILGLYDRLEISHHKNASTITDVIETMKKVENLRKKSESLNKER